MNIKLAGLALTAVLALAACGQTTPPPTGGGSNGTVMFTLPDAGADVTYTVTNDANGEMVSMADQDDTAAGVKLSGLSEGSYTITISKPGFQSATARFTVGANGSVTFTEAVPTTLTPVTGGGTPGTPGTVITGMAGDFNLTNGGPGTTYSSGTTPLTVNKGGKFFSVLFVKDGAFPAEGAGRVEMKLPEGLNATINSAKYTVGTAGTNNGDAPWPYTAQSAKDAVINATAKTVSATVASLASGVQLVLVAEITVAANAAAGSYCFTTPNIPGKTTEPTNKTTAEANLRCVKVQ